MLRYQEGCCCFKARTGVVIIAILGIIGSVSFIIAESIILGFVGSVQFWVPEPDLRPILIGEIVGNGCTLIINGCMWFGVTNNQNWMVLLWLIFGIVRLITYTIGVIGGCIILCLVWWGGVGYAFILIAIGTPLLVLGYYFWFVVRSVYYEIKDNDLPSLN
jgi:hypothetical protein